MLYEVITKGLALILAIGLLLVLSILGAVVMKVSLEDFKRSSTFNPQREAFYVADRTVEYAMNRDIIYSLMTPNVPLDLAAGSHKTIIEQDVITSYSIHYTKLYEGKGIFKRKLKMAAQILPNFVT